MTRHFLPATALALALLVPHSSMSAARPSNVVDLGHLGGGFSDAFGINNDPGSVQVVGRSTRADGFTHAFFWPAPRPQSAARDLNDFGVVVGGSGSGQLQAVVWRLP